MSSIPTRSGATLALNSIATPLPMPRIRAALLGLLVLAACRGNEADTTPATPPMAARVSDEALRHAGERLDDWLTHGRVYAEDRFSPLDQIHHENVHELGLVWSLDTETHRGLEATPLVADGILYTTGSWSVVFAVDATTGAVIWKWDPKVPRSYGQVACCDVVNRGVALYEGKVFVGVLDGRLAALDAATGRVIWEVATVDPNRPYTITGAPRIVQGNVIIGNGGAELGVRGYVSAYSAADGELAWRFYTVPGDPSQPFESKAMERAAQTWQGGEWWKVGGGGTVWDSLAYDPELDLLYVGTGNGSPWNRHLRSPGGGDNLYLSSILALRPANGELVWHYQTTPGDTWDYTATQHMILTDLEIAGEIRKVLLQAPKNGFFYVLDRATGELLSAEPYVTVNWARGIDMDTGRPLELAGSDYSTEIAQILPSSLGGHNWQPMSYSPETGLVYLPAMEMPAVFAQDAQFEYRPGAWNTGVDFSLNREFPRELAAGHLLAWDPVEQKPRWQVPYDSPWNGGTLATAGNLVFQGTADGRFVAYKADDGTALWETWAGTGIVAPPMTYRVNGTQYVSVMAGWGGAFALFAGDAARAAGVQSVGRLLTFALGGAEALPASTERTERTDPAPPRLAALPVTASPRTVETGARLFSRWCMVCHGIGAVGGGVISDLRYSPERVFDRYVDVVLKGSLSERGMPSFQRWLTPEDVEAIRSYVLARRAELAALPSR